MSAARYKVWGKNLICCLWEESISALEFGNAVSALKNTIPGDLLSTDLKEIEGIIREHKATGRVAEMDR